MCFSDLVPVLVLAPAMFLLGAGCLYIALFVVHGDMGLLFVMAGVAITLLSLAAPFLSQDIRFDKNKRAWRVVCTILPFMTYRKGPFDEIGRLAFETEVDRGGKDLGTSFVLHVKGSNTREAYSISNGRTGFMRKELQFFVGEPPELSNKIEEKTIVTDNY